MGLDMYLYRYPKSKTREQIEQESNELWNKSIEEWRKGWKEVYEIAYWRKVNFLHGWFVRTLAGNVDECQDITVRKCNMESLKVLVDKACSVILKAKLVPQKDISAKDDWRAKYVDDPDKEAIPVVWNAEEGKFEGVDKNTPLPTLRRGGKGAGGDSPVCRRVLLRLVLLRPVVRVGYAVAPGEARQAPRGLGR